MKKDAKRAAKIQQKEHLTNVFLVQFVVVVVYSMYVWLNMYLYSNHAILAHNMVVWSMTIPTAIALVFVSLPYVWKGCPTGPWWRTFCYSFAFLGLLYCILNLHVALGKATANIPWLAFAKFGNEWSGLKLQFGWIWLGFLVCFIIYMVRYNRVGRAK